MREKYLKPKDVAEILSISTSAARVIMPNIPGCINVGSGENNRCLRVPESGLEAWRSNKVICIQHSDGKIARRKIGRSRTG